MPTTCQLNSEAIIMYSTLDVINNLTREKREMLSIYERAILEEYIYYFNNHGRRTNSFSPRNSAIYRIIGITRQTFYKYRKALADKGFITVINHDFEPTKDGKHKHTRGQGRQRPATISLASWLVESHKVSVADSDIATPESTQQPQKSVRKRATTINVAELSQYGKDLATQIGATAPVYPRQLARIQGYENKTSKEVIKLVRSYVNKHTNTNPWKYYEAVLEDLIANNIESVTKLAEYNPALAGKSRKPVQQQLPLMAITKKKNMKKQQYRKYVNGKRVEQGTDWEAKTRESNLRQARKYLGLSENEPFPVEYNGLTAQEIVNKAYVESGQAEELEELRKKFAELENDNYAEA